MPDVQEYAIQVSPGGVSFIEIPMADMRVGDVMLAHDVDRGRAWRITDVRREPARVIAERVAIEGTNPFWDGSPILDRPDATRRVRPRESDVLVTRYGFPPRDEGESDYAYLMRVLRAFMHDRGTDRSGIFERLNTELWHESRLQVDNTSSYQQRAAWIFARLREEAGASTPAPSAYTFPGTTSPVPAHRHHNGGGWVADTATVSRLAYVDAMVYGNAHVAEYASIRGNARIYGNAVVESHACVEGEAQVYDDARIRRDAYVGGTARIHGTAQIRSRDEYVGHGDITSTPAFRVCTRCRREQRQDSQNFSQSNGRWNAWCRECMRSYARERRAAATNNRPGNRRFGVEIEFHGSQQAVVRAMVNAGLACEAEGYNHRVRNHWKVIGDASVNNGGELVSPILRGASGFTAIRKACQALRAAGATVSVQTGLHVHHDVAGLTVSAFKRMVANWYRSQEAIDEMVSPSRRDGQWSHHLDSYDMDAVSRVETLPEAKEHFGGIDRYKALNLNAYSVHGTVEVRMHQGTLNPDKIISWVKFGQAFISAAVDGVDIECTHGAEVLEHLAHLESSVCDFLNQRIRALASDPYADEGEQNGPYCDDDDEACDGCGYYECECGPDFARVA